MRQMKIKNFGPIKNGFNDNNGYFEVKRVTIFIGDQGTGKSTVAKLFSTFSWLEKAIYRGDYENISVDDFKDLVEMQQIPCSYFVENTEIVYKGIAYNFIYKNNEFFFGKSKTFENYVRSKVMYFSAERNLLSILKNIEDNNNIPNMLSVFSNRYESAKEYFKTKTINLPLDNYSIELDSDKSVYVNTKESQVSLNQASSGMQSLVPIILTEKYLNETIEKKLIEKLKNVRAVTFQKSILKKINDDELKRKVKTFFVSGIRANFKKEELDLLQNLLKTDFNYCLTSIIEEPELNLYPISQKNILKELISVVNQNKNNSLFITTHSPYILGTLNNLIYAGNLTEQKFDCEKIISNKNQISIRNISAYKIQNGDIKSIIDDELKLIKNSEIDECSDLINDEYAKLENIELS